MKQQFTSSLADAILAMPSHLIQERGLVEAREALDLPWSHMGGENHILLPHRAVGEMMADESARYPQRFVLDDEVASLVNEMPGDDIESHRAVRASAALPGPRGWVEWRSREDRNVKYGVLWSEVGGSVKTRAYGCSDSAGPAFICWADFEDETFATCEVRGRSDFQSLYGVDLVNKLGSMFALMFVAFCAFVTTPHACETKWQGAPPQLNKARIKRGKAPFLSFNRVNFFPYRPAGSQEHRDTGSEGVRLHRVIAHWRTIIRENQARRILVKSHMRGNARLGVVLHERHV